MHEQTAAELIAVCLETGSESAWLQLVNRFQPLIASVILRIVRRYGHPNYSIVDDLVQETFLRLCRDDSKSLRQFDHRHEAAIFGYLKVVAASVATDHFRALKAQKRMGETAVDSEDLASIPVKNEVNAEDRLLIGEIESCIKRITDDERDESIFWLYYRQGFTAKDIAGLPGIGLSAKGIESCLFRLIKAVRREMTPGQPQAEGLQPPSALGEMR
jgi:RNA polymerase sigma-70 factor (ECF subfamily)